MEYFVVVKSYDNGEEVVTHYAYKNITASKKMVTRLNNGNYYQQNLGYFYKVVRFVPETISL